MNADPESNVTWRSGILAKCSEMTTKGFNVADECIHGLGAGLCDQCYPKPVPEGEPAATSRATSRPRATSRATSRATLRRTGAAASLPSDSVSEQRIYHLTHVSNLADILRSGGLLADVNDTWITRPTVDISSVDTRESRRTIVVSSGSPSVASYVPFFLVPNSTLWEGMRANLEDPRLSPDTRDRVVSDFVILVSTVKKVLDSRTEDPDAIVVTDGDAADGHTRFSTTPGANERMLRKLRADEDSPIILEAEFLVSEAFPFELVTLVGVANDKARDGVKSILQSSAHRPKVAVYPPWFQRAQ